MTTTPTLQSSTDICQQLDIPYQRLHRWTAKGAITPTQPSTGTGSRTGWSTDDATRLAAIIRVYNDLNTLGIDCPWQLVAELWHHLTTWNTAELHTDTVTITVHLEKGEQ
jgi:hypothetical protein